MGWRIRRNDLPDVIRALPREIDREVQDFADNLAEAIEGQVWRDTGVIAGNTEVHERREMFASVAVGYYLGKGFYSGFQEFGTSRQSPRPVVVPIAHEGEPVFASFVTDGVRRACRA